MKTHVILTLFLLAGSWQFLAAQVPATPSIPVASQASKANTPVPPVPAPLKAPVIEAGNFRFLSAIPKPAPTIMLLDDKPFPKKGLANGQETGPFRWATGTMRLEIKNGDLKPLKEALPVRTDEQTFNIIYLEQSYDQEKKMMTEKIKLHPYVEKNAGKGYSLTLLSTCFTPANLKINGASYVLEQFKAVEVPGWKGGALSATADEGVKAATFEPDYATHYMAVVYDQPNGKRGVTFILVF